MKPSAAAEEGGFKSSGVGRLRGLAAIADFLEHKCIHVALGIAPPSSPASEVHR